MNADAIVLGAGAVAFAGNFKDSSGFPPNGFQIVGATLFLAFLFSLTKEGPLAGPTKALAGLMLLVAIYRYTPGLFNVRKVKKNG
jgi:hypothetical protein